MLRRATSRSGHTIFYQDERLLASRGDPVREAELWIESSAEAIRSAQVIVVLGLGCGYHVVQLAQKYPQKKILVIEANAVLARQVRELHGLDLAQVEIAVADHVEQITKMARFQKILMRIFVLLQHQPSIAFQPAFYEELRRLALGRDRMGLQYHLRMRDSMDALFDWKKLMAVSADLLSIKDLTDSLRTDSLPNSSAQMLLCLKEFVK